MSLHSKLKDEMKQAMIAKDQVKLSTVRGLISSFANELISKGSSEPFLDDEGALTIIKRNVKQRKDAIEQFEKGGRSDLAESEKAELAILETYLPATMSREEIEKFVLAKKAELGEVDKNRSGQFVGAIMKELKGKADGADVKAVVDKVLG